MRKIVFLTLLLYNMAMFAQSAIEFNCDEGVAFYVNDVNGKLKTFIFAIDKENARGISFSAYILDGEPGNYEGTQLVFDSKSKYTAKLEEDEDFGSREIETKVVDPDNTYCLFKYDEWSNKGSIEINSDGSDSKQIYTLSDPFVELAIKIQRFHSLSVSYGLLDWDEERDNMVKAVDKINHKFDPLKKNCSYNVTSLVMPLLDKVDNDNAYTIEVYNNDLIIRKNGKVMTRYRDLSNSQELTDGWYCIKGKETDEFYISLEGDDALVWIKSISDTQFKIVLNGDPTKSTNYAYYIVERTGCLNAKKFMLMKKEIDEYTKKSSKEAKNAAPTFGLS